MSIFDPSLTAKFPLVQFNIIQKGELKTRRRPNYLKMAISDVELWTFFSLHFQLIFPIGIMVESFDCPNKQIQSFFFLRFCFSVEFWEWKKSCGFFITKWLTYKKRENCCCCCWCRGSLLFLFFHYYYFWSTAAAFSKKKNVAFCLSFF